MGVSPLSMPEAKEYDNVEDHRSQLGVARARSIALREEMDNEPFIHITAEEDYRAHQRGEEEQWSKANIMQESQNEHYARHTELIHSTSVYDEVIDVLMARSQLHILVPVDRSAYDSELRVQGKLEKTRERMIIKLNSVASRQTIGVPKITETAAEFRKRMLGQADTLPEPAYSKSEQLMTSSVSAPVVSAAPPSSSHGIHQTSAKEYVDFMRATLEFDMKAQHAVDNQVGLGGEDTPAINYGGLRTASERELAEHAERNTYSEARERMEYLRLQLQNEQRYDERHGGY